jgi:hypothetical protein
MFGLFWSMKTFAAAMDPKKWVNSFAYSASLAGSRPACALPALCPACLDPPTQSTTQVCQAQHEQAAAGGAPADRRELRLPER